MGELLRSALEALGPIAVLSAGGVALAVGIGLRVAPTRWRRGLPRGLDPLRRMNKRRLPYSTAYWLGAIVLLAGLFRAFLGDALHVPVVLGDELIYEGLAKGWAAQGEPVLRGSRDLADSVFYPLFVAPPFHFAADGASALVAAKVMNATAMAVTALPAYLFARRALPRGWALGVAALTVIVPWTMYAALIMTESLFYPVFVAYAVVLVWTLDRPTILRQAGLVGTLAVLVGVRAQGLSVALGTVVAIVLAGAVDERGLIAALRRFLPTLVVFAAGAATAIGASHAGVAVPTSSYNVLFHSVGAVGRILEWAVWTLGIYELPLGIVALAALPVALAGMLRRDGTPAVRSAAAATIGLGASLLASVALLSASPYGLNHLHERNLFYVTPLVLTCVAHWLRRGMERPLLLSMASAAACVALAWLLPQRLIHFSNNVDVPTASFLLALEARVPSVHLRLWLMLFAVVGAGTFLIARKPVFPIFAVILAFTAVTASVDIRDNLTSSQLRQLAWVDHALPSGATANLVYLGGRFQNCNANAGAQSGLTVWTEWFNARVTTVDYVGGANPADGLPPPTRLTIRRSGKIFRGGKPFSPDYVVLDSRQSIVGKRLDHADLSRITGAEDQRPPASLTLWRVTSPLRFKLLKFSGGSVRGRGLNLIPNGDFDTGVNGWAGNTGTETITAKPNKPGAAADTLMAVKTSGHLFSGVFLSRKLAVRQRTGYIFSFRVRGTRGQTVLPTLESFSTTSKTPSSIVQPSGVPLTGSWQLVVLDYTAPRGSTHVIPAIVLSGTHKTTIAVDSVRLVRGSSATPGICPP